MTKTFAPALGALAIMLALGGCQSGDAGAPASTDTAEAPAPASTAASSDPLLWLETPRDDKALAWARQATDDTRKRLGDLPLFTTIRQELDGVLAQAPSEPDQVMLGDHAMRFLRDGEHPYGLLQTAPRNAQGVPGEWKTVLDVAALREREGVPFELHAYELDSACLAPEYTRCLLSLSPGGGDEVEIREFDLTSGDFVADGFRIPRSRAFARWMGPDQLLVEHTSASGQPLTIAGWPTSVQLWVRGESLDSAREVFRGKPEDAILQIGTVGSGAGTQGIVARAIDYSTFEMTLIGADGQTRPLPLPAKLKPFGLLGTTGHNLLVQLAEDAEIAGTQYPSETVIAYDATKDGADAVSVVYQPEEDEFVDAGFGGLAAGRDEVALVVNKHLQQRVVAVSDTDGGWKARDLLQVKPGETITVHGAGGDSNEFVVAVSGFITPRSQYLVRSGQDKQLLAKDPVQMDTSGLVTEVGSATSKDGTSIDYFLLKPKVAADGPTPLLMTGYGAFGISLRPGYFDATSGGPAMQLWLKRGGAVAIPAIRGGGERGSAWHMDVIREKRQLSYDDFIAVTEHLQQSGFTTPAQTGIFGMSNGGLLTATLGTERPDLFGAVVSDVPLTDLIRMRHMGMGAAWMDEYGNPDNPEQAKAMLAYSPYQNVREGTTYPPFMVTISTEDNRVGPGHARKFAHRLMDAGATTYFYEDDEGGHGVSDAFRNPELMALRMSFLISNLMPASH